MEHSVEDGEDSGASNIVPEPEADKRTAAARPTQHTTAFECL
jgi:hypothetical protein